MFADLTLYDRSGHLTAVVAIKNKLGTSSDWAAQMRRNLLAYGGPCSADFFLLITPDRLYLWKDTDPAPVCIPPAYEADPQPAFAPYFERAGVVPHRVSEHAFELLVVAWLGDVIRSTEPAEERPDDQSWLATSGFRTAVKDGRIEYEAVV